MRFFSWIVVSLIFTLVITCEKNNQEIDIRGDWYMYNFSTDSPDSLKSGEINFNYWEVSVANSLIFSYINNNVGFINPSEYYIKKDSFFDVFGGSPDSELGYNGKIKLLSNNHLIFYTDLDTTNYYRLTNTTDLLSNYIINKNSDNSKFNDSDNTYSKAFQKRSDELYLDVKDTLSTNNN